MRKLLLAAGAILALGGGAANATTKHDPTGDFLPTYTGPKTADLDVTAFTVDYDFSGASFLVSADFAGTITPSSPGFYVIGVNTGAGTFHPFGPVGQPNVLFDQVMVIQKSGVGTLSGHALTATITGSHLSVMAPLSFLPSTGFAARDYGFSIWTRQVTGGLASLADFAPDNATLSAAPEPAAWTLMIAGFGLAGAVLRRRRAHPVRA